MKSSKSRALSADAPRRAFFGIFDLDAAGRSASRSLSEAAQSLARRASLRSTTIRSIASCGVTPSIAFVAASMLSP